MTFVPAVHPLVRLIDSRVREYNARKPRHRMLYLLVERGRAQDEADLYMRKNEPEAPEHDVLLPWSHECARMMIHTLRTHMDGNPTGNWRIVGYPAWLAAEISEGRLDEQSEDRYISQHRRTLRLFLADAHHATTFGVPPEAWEPPPPGLWKRFFYKLAGEPLPKPKRPTPKLGKVSQSLRAGQINLEEGIKPDLIKKLGAHLSTQLAQQQTPGFVNVVPRFPPRISGQRTQRLEDDFIALQFRPTT